MRPAEVESEVGTADRILRIATNKTSPEGDLCWVYFEEGASAGFAVCFSATGFVKRVIEPFPS